MGTLKDRLSDSVGDKEQGAVNRDRDVKTVQGLLNAQIVRAGRSDRLLSITGRVDSDTSKAISEFQRRQGITQTGLISQGDKTYAELYEFGAPRSMSSSRDLRDWLKTRGEGFKAYPYDDVNQPPNATIGYGHKLHSGPVTPHDREKYREGITPSQADSILRSDLSSSESEIGREVGVPLTQSQFDALTSLVLNIGPINFRGSTLLKALKVGDYCAAHREFGRWNKVRDNQGHYVKVKGLTNRRTYEAELFSRGFRCG